MLQGADGFLLDVVEGEVEVLEEVEGVARIEFDGFEVVGGDFEHAEGGEAGEVFDLD